jgi:hypothetical protein
MVRRFVNAERPPGRLPGMNGHPATIPNHACCGECRQSTVRKLHRLARQAGRPAMPCRRASLYNPSDKELSKPLPGSSSGTTRALEKLSRPGRIRPAFRFSALPCPEGPSRAGKHHELSGLPRNSDDYLPEFSSNPGPERAARRGPFRASYYPSKNQMIEGSRSDDDL